MKNKFWSLKFLPVLFAVALVVVANGCKEQDEMYRQYVVEGGKKYPGMAQDVKVRNGRERVEISWLNTDPLVTEAKIFWNNYQNSVTVDIPAGTDKVVQMVNVPEGDYSFFIKTCDGEGNESVPAETSGRSYGAMYEQALLNRLLKNVDFDEGSSLVILDWDRAEKDVIGVQLEYTDMSGNKQTYQVLNTEETTVKSDVKISEPLYYITMYQPDAALDVLYTQKQSFKVSTEKWRDVTSEYLKNTERPFTRGAFKGNGCYEAAFWETNDQGGLNGLVDSGKGDALQIYVWIGWSPYPQILNGKAYQTIVDLPAGKYHFDAILLGSWYDGSIANFKLYVVAALDNIPDIGDVGATEQTLDFVSIPMGSSENSTFSVEFELSVKSTVSLGFVGNFTDCNSVAFKKVELWSFRGL